MALLSSALRWGTHAARPAATSNLEAITYFETDTLTLWQVQSATWVQIASISSGGGGGVGDHRVKAYNAAGMAHPNAGTRYLMDTEFNDTDNYHSVSANTDRFTVPTGLAGLYQIEWQFVCPATGGREDLSIFVNGTEIAREGVTIGQAYTTRRVSAAYRLAVADYVQFGAVNSGGSVTSYQTGDLTSTWAGMSLIAV